jgi:hypothetical protein
VLGELTTAAVLLAVVAVLAWSAMREDARLRRTARQYRELELEGIEELRRSDPYPEHVAVDGGYLREPDGRAAAADAVLMDEMQRAREHTRRVHARRSRTRSPRRGKGAKCLG